MTQEQERKHAVKHFAIWMIVLTWIAFIQEAKAAPSGDLLGAGYCESHHKSH